MHDLLDTQYPTNYLRFMAAQRVLDRIDREMVAILSEDSRITNQELARRVGLAPSTSLERVRRLRESGVILGVHAEVDPEALGVGVEALVAVRMRQHTRELVEGFQAYAAALPEVVHIFHLTGAEDFLIHVACRDVHHLRQFSLDAFTTREEVAQIHTSLIYEQIRQHRLPDYLDSPPS
jgi:DNA-binding Lrp family transcriptional regulator